MFTPTYTISLAIDASFVLIATGALKNTTTIVLELECNNTKPERCALAY